MTPKLLLRISSALIFFHAILHTMGQMQWKVAASPAYAEVVTQMTGPKFPFMGAERSMGEFFDGFGITVTIALLLVGCLLWALSDIAIAYGGAGLKLLIPVVVFLILLCVIEIIYFFAFAAVVTGLAAMLSTWAIVGLNNSHLEKFKASVK
jgi:hypothetical protein